MTTPFAAPADPHAELVSLNSIKNATQPADDIGVPAAADASTLDRPVAYSRERSLEAEVLMQALNDLRGANVLTDAEFEAKCQHHHARL